VSKLLDRRGRAVSTSAAAQSQQVAFKSAMEAAASGFPRASGSARPPARLFRNSSDRACSRRSIRRALLSQHGPAGQLLGSAWALTARVRALRRYPIVVIAWASLCGPCRSEFSLFADASVLDGRRVAFLGADISDSAGDARSFLAQHPVSYPSYQASITDLASLAVIEGAADDDPHRSRGERRLRAHRSVRFAGNAG
jgi:thiol-disulfide isomerase/thioredoxin